MGTLCPPFLSQYYVTDRPDMPSDVFTVDVYKTWKVVRRKSAASGEGRIEGEHEKAFSSSRKGGFWGSPPRKS